MKFSGVEKSFSFLNKKAKHSLIALISLVFLIYSSLYVVGCESDAYFASSTFFCDKSVEGVSCENAPSQSGAEVVPGANQGSSSQNLLSRRSAVNAKNSQYPLASSQKLLAQADAADSGRLITITSSMDKVDFLFVVDNSGSMNEELSSIAHQFDPFLDTIRDMDYHIAIMGAYVGGGVFEKFSNGEIYLTNPGRSSSVHSDNVSMFQQRIQDISKRGDRGDAEQGIAALSASLDKRNQYDFFRPHSLLVAIVLSDEDENPLYPQGRPEAFFQKFSETHEFSVVTIHSIIYKPGDTNSTCPNGATHGHNYVQASNPSRTLMETYGNILRGHVGSICATNYSSQLGPIAEHAINNRVLPLPCRPLSNNVFVKVNGRQAEARVQGRKVSIRGRVPFGAETEVSFRCKR